jgi:hypothetical protein
MNSMPHPSTIRCFLYRLVFCLLRDVAINRRTMSHVPEV